MIEIPIERAQALGRLVAAARVWRANLIPGTSSGLQGPTSVLLRAIEELDEQTPPCDHPREKRVFYPWGETCGACGDTVYVHEQTTDTDGAHREAGEGRGDQSDP